MDGYGRGRSRWMPGSRIRLTIVLAIGLIGCGAPLATPGDGGTPPSSSAVVSPSSQAPPAPAASPSITTASPTAAPSSASPPVTPTAAASATAVRTARPTTAAPTAVPTPTARPTARPTATPAVASRLVRHGSRLGHAVALTYDMGGRIGDAIAIMTWLVDHDVHATIFMTGAMADSQATDAGRRVLAIIEAHPDLFTLGNHSYTHTDFRTLTASQIRDELRRTEIALARTCTQDPHPFFRPPNGGYDADVLAAVGAAGYRTTVTWDIDTIDWRPIRNDPPGPTADQIVSKVLANAQGGSIVLDHLGGYETYTALPRVVDGLRAAGFDLVNLDEMLGG